MKANTRKLLDNFAERRLTFNSKENQALRKYTADVMRSRRKAWCHFSARNSEMLICNQREYVLQYKLIFGVNYERSAA